MAILTSVPVCNPIPVSIVNEEALTDDGDVRSKNARESLKTWNLMVS